MQITQTTLKKFFSLEELSNSRFAELEKSKEFKSIRGKISKKLKGMPVPKDFFKLMLNQVSDLLNIDMRAILVNAWTKSGKFFEYSDMEKYPADETFYVPLAEHTITSEHKPSLKPVINNISLGEIVFTIILELTLKGAVLKIRDGRIIEVFLDAGKGKGAIKYGDFSILEKEIEELKLPGSIRLGKGIPINEQVGDVYHIIDEIIETEDNGAEIEN
ncbi:MAG: hypothetical protein JSW07_02085 [bacterium]|nr:MAG: hypothetical protein JSW07_02085 [bacterium]